MNVSVLKYDEYVLIKERADAFIDTLYAGYPYPVHSLKEINRQYFHAAVITEAGNAITSQAMLYKNRGISINNEPALLVGNYESIDDKNVCEANWKTIFHIAKQENQWLVGPVNGSTWAAYRYGLDHGLPLFFTEPLHQPYYPQHFLSQGFHTIAGYASYLDSALWYSEEEIIALENRIHENGLEIRAINLENFEQELKEVHELTLQVFKNNFLFSPVSFTDFYAMYQPLQRIIDPEFCLLAFEDKKVAAVFFCLKDIYDPKGETLVIKTIARLPGRKYAATIRLMTHKVIKSARNKNIKRVIHAFMHVSNTSINISKYFSGKPYKHYALYAKQLY